MIVTVGKEHARKTESMCENVISTTTVALLRQEWLLSLHFLTLYIEVSFFKLHTNRLGLFLFKYKIVYFSTVAISFSVFSLDSNLPLLVRLTN